MAGFQAVTACEYDVSVTPDGLAVNHINGLRPCGEALNPERKNNEEV